LLPKTPDFSQQTALHARGTARTADGSALLLNVSQQEFNRAAQARRGRL
jgi:hypothetical protein